MPFIMVGERRLFYREQGEGPLLLILPGNTASSASHLDEMAYYSNRFHVVSLDFWGTGQSERADSLPLNWFHLAASDAAALAARLDPEKAIWMGTSGGGIAALLAAIQFPERVRAVIADSTPEHFDAESIEVLLADRGKQTAGQISFWSSAQGQNWQQVVDADTEFLRRLAFVSGGLYNGRLTEISCPVLFTASLQDDLIPDVSGQVIKMAGQISGSQVFFANHGGHPLMWSCPELFRKFCDKFIANLAEDSQIG
jgi:valacyclovir hydrolase